MTLAPAWSGQKKDKDMKPHGKRGVGSSGACEEEEQKVKFSSLEVVSMSWLHVWCMWVQCWPLDSARRLGAAGLGSMMALGSLTLEHLISQRIQGPDENQTHEGCMHACVFGGWASGSSINAAGLNVKLTPDLDSRLT